MIIATIGIVIIIIIINFLQQPPTLPELRILQGTGLRWRWQCWVGPQRDRPTGPPQAMSGGGAAPGYRQRPFQGTRMGGFVRRRHPVAGTPGKTGTCTDPDVRQVNGWFLFILLTFSSIHKFIIYEFIHSFIHAFMQACIHSLRFL